MPQPPTMIQEHLFHDLQQALSSLQEEVRAERVLACARHAEILTKLQEEKETEQRIEDKTALLEKNTSMEFQEIKEIKETIQTQSTNPILASVHAKSQEFSERARKLTKSLETIDDSQSHSIAMNKEGHLSRNSTFGFGIKAKEVSFTSKDQSTFRLNILHNCKMIVKHDRFEAFIACLILANAIIMCFEVQYEGIQIGFELQYDGIEVDAVTSWPGAPVTLSFLDWLFGITFFLEAILKVLTLRVAYFKAYWNWLDFVCVLAFVADKVFEALSASPFDAQVIRLTRLFRLVRLVRLIRTLEHLDVLYVMISAIKGMTMIVVWSVSLLSVLLMTCALFLSRYLHSVYFNVVATEASDLAKQQLLFKYFGTFSRCMLSMFEITLANWGPVARLLAEEVTEWFSVICVIHKLTIGFAVIGVINGVILQETFKVANTDNQVMVRQKRRAKAQMKKKTEALFKALDYDKDGQLDFEEFMVIAKQPDVMLWLESLEFETDDLLTLFLLLDKDGDSKLSLNELCSQFPRLRGSARTIDVLAMRNGIPSTQLLEEICQETGEKKYTWAETPSNTKDNLDVILQQAGRAYESEGTSVAAV